MGTKGQNSLKKKINKVNQKIKRKVRKSKNEDEEHILKTADIELTDVKRSGHLDDDKIHLSEDDIAINIDNNNGYCKCGNRKTVKVSNDVTVCGKCGLHIDDGIHHDFSSHHHQTEKSRKKKRKKKVGYRMWRACVMGWKYMKAGLVFYITPATAGLNVANLATAATATSGRNDHMYTKYAYVYK